MKKYILSLLIICTTGVFINAQDTQDYDIHPQLISESKIVVTPENGIRPVSYTDLDLSAPKFRLQPISSPPYGSLRFNPEHGFAEGYMHLGAILSHAFDVPDYRIIGSKELLSETYEFAYVNFADEESFYQTCKDQIREILPYSLRYELQEVQKYELRIAESGIKMEPSITEERRATGTTEGIKGTGYSLENLARFISSHVKADVINNTEKDEFFNIDFTIHSMKEIDELITELELQLGLILEPVTEKDWVLFVE